MKEKLIKFLEKQKEIGDSFSLNVESGTYPKGGASCYKDSFAVNQTLAFQIKFCGKHF